MARLPSKTGSLFDFADRRTIPAPTVARVATVHTTSPRPSIDAAKEINESGVADNLCRRIEAVLGSKDDRQTARTPGEIAAYLNALDGGKLDSVKVLKRLADLRNAGVAVTFGYRRCEENKRSAGVWVLVNSCCGDIGRHIVGRLPDGKTQTIQCGHCFNGLGVREVGQ